MLTSELMAQLKPLDKAEYEALAAFRYALRSFLHFSEEAANEVGLTPQQHQALLAIKGFPGRERITISELAERLRLRHHSAVGLINRLVVERLVVRMPSPDDGRKVLIALSKRGEKILEQLSATHRDQLKIIGPELADLIRRLSQGYF